MMRKTMKMSLMKIVSKMILIWMMKKLLLKTMMFTMRNKEFNN